LITAGNLRSQQSGQFTDSPAFISHLATFGQSLRIAKSIWLDTYLVIETQNAACKHPVVTPATPSIFPA
jgi:hypothetical protein